ncbi:MAG: lytic transglycosylase domain-containing protein [Bryobacterales bacterium]|nr:lytic transglycosylase domain-containing protein [Bryobacterales bacterium]
MMTPLLAFFLFAGEEIVLHTGYRIPAKGHEIVGENIRIRSGEGTVEIPRASVAAIETLEPPAALPATPPSAVPAPPPPPPPKTTKEHLHDAANGAGLPPEILLSIAKIESAFQTNARSPKGAIGVMQLMPDTARALNVNPHDTKENIEGGARLLRDLLVKYENYPDQVYRALSAYNAGPGAVQKYNGVPPYAETRAYVEKVLNEYHRLKTQKPHSR